MTAASRLPAQSLLAIALALAIPACAPSVAGAGERERVAAPAGPERDASPGPRADETPHPPPSGRPVVHVIATGGTISNTDDERRLTGEQIVASSPGIEALAELTVEQFSNIPSGSMTPQRWLALARRVDAAFGGRPELAGVIITHGTDTMEETAYFLHLVIGDDRPILLTGAMRNASEASHDGPANLLDAVRIAIAPDARGRGAMIVLNDEALPAREATKLNTSRVQAFDAPGRGRLAVADPDTVVFQEPVAPRPPPLLTPDRIDSLPRVDIIYAYAGADGSLVDAAVAAGARGIVMASVGRGGVTPGQGAAIRRALERGVVVVTSSRTQSGRVPIGTDADRLEDHRPGRGIRFGAGDLTPQKARVLLILALAATHDPARLLDIFRTY